jgi:HD-GYP domain-containing protein (c-di-GMP phosphodiesterase class II)
MAFARSRIPRQPFVAPERLPEFVRRLVAQIKAHDPDTWRHSERVARIAAMLGERMGLSRSILSDLYVAGLLHDIGKLGLPDEILQKQGALTEAEFDRVKQHPGLGEALLSQFGALGHLRPIVRHHHERFDGRGYPDRLAGAEIPFLARILALADAFDAMNSDRPYRKACPREQLDERVALGAGKAWDPYVVSVFLGCRDEIYALGHGPGDPIKVIMNAMLNKNARFPAVYFDLPPKTRIAKTYGPVLRAWNDEATMR